MFKQLLRRLRLRQKISAWASGCPAGGGGADACFSSRYAACECGTGPRRAPPAALPGGQTCGGVLKILYRLL
jgi:hypothetical protein